MHHGYDAPLPPHRAPQSVKKKARSRVNAPSTRCTPTRPLNPPPPRSPLTQRSPDGSSTAPRGAPHDNVALRCGRHSGPLLHVLAPCALVRLPPLTSLALSTVDPPPPPSPRTRHTPSGSSIRPRGAPHDSATLAPRHTSMSRAPMSGCLPSPHPRSEEHRPLGVGCSGASAASRFSR